MTNRQHAVQGMTGFCCSVCDPQGLRSFPSSKALQHHARTAHQLTLCTTCLEVLPCNHPCKQASKAYAVLCV